jgi:MFS family permease
MAAQSGIAGTVAMTDKVGRVRYLIVFMLFVVTMINYADRATISIAGPALSKELGLNPVQMGYIFSAFGWSYVAAQIPGGWLLDRFGSRTIYFWSIFIWSLFTLLQIWSLFTLLQIWSLFTLLQGSVNLLGSAAAAVTALFGLRLLVGLAEAPSFPANGRIVAAWFPANERGTASAIFNSAQYFATALFAPIMGWFVYSYGWPSVFYLMLMALAFFGKGIGALGWAVVSDTSPKEIAGLSGGLFNTFGNIASITTPIVIGYIIQNTGSFNGALVFVGANALVAMLSYLVIVGEIKRVELTKA